MLNHLHSYETIGNLERAILNQNMDNATETMAWVDEQSLEMFKTL